MRLLDGNELAGFIQARHEQIMRSLHIPVKLVILCSGSDPSAAKYSRVKQRYGESLGIEVQVINVEIDNIVKEIDELNHDATVTGLIVPLPLPTEKITDEALGAIVPAKDIDGLGPNTKFQAATPKGILWLLAGYNIDLTGTIGIVGQGRLVGKPLADSLCESGRKVIRCDDKTDLRSVLPDCDIIISATGKQNLLTSEMVKQRAVIVDAGSPFSEIADDLRERPDIIITPNPGGVGPMTVAALFDNLLLAASSKTIERN
jgi:methylenetetrahydrofolate dehydrogenase (NADP+)/methenyltetrahydrofolate cyclohydrolase